jgi:hypothetical protein
MTQANFQQNQETIFYQDETGLVVTPTRIMFGSKLFFLRNLSSIRIVEIESNKVYPSILMAIGIIILLAAYPQVKTDFLNGATGIGIAAACLIGSFVWFKLQKSYFALKLGSSSGEVNLVISKNRPYLETIVAAINQAIPENRSF